MSARLLPLVLSLTRGWVRVYTCHLPSQVAETRRDEVESDIWEMQHDGDVAPGLRSAWIALSRLLDGIPDDLAWRFDNAATEEQLVVRRLFAFTAATALVVSLWTVSSLFVNGQQDVEACAAAAPAPQTSADLRFEVMRCAGAYFSPKR